MTAFRVSMAVGSSDLNRGLRDGSVGIPGVEPVVRAYPSPERHWRMLRNAEFDVAEVSVGTFRAVNDLNPGRFVAVPAFPHRRFRHSYVCVAAGFPLTSAEELRGGRIVIRTWTNTAGVWTRGILQDEYGVALRDVTWYAGRGHRRGQRPGGVHPRASSGRRVRRVAHGARGAGRAHRPGDPRCARPSGRPDWLRRLSTDSRAEEENYFRKTANFPIMHTVALRAELVKENPWLASDMLAAFRTSRDAALAAIADPARSRWPGHVTPMRRIVRSWGTPLSLTGSREQPALSGDGVPLRGEPARNRGGVQCGGHLAHDGAWRREAVRTHLAIRISPECTRKGDHV